MVDDDGAIEAAVVPLHAANESDARAIESLRAALEVWPEDQE